MATINDRVSFVQLELGNRADLTTGNPSRIQNWIWQSYLNLGMSYKFSESNVTVEDQWEAGADALDYPDGCRAVINVSFFQRNGTAIKVNWKDIAYLRRYPNNPSNVGPPAIIATFGQKIFVRPLCDQQVYDVVIDFWQKPVQAAAIGDTVLLVPDDFLEVIDMGAMMRGHFSLGEAEKAQALQQALFGFTVPLTGKFVPGLIATMYNRRQAEAPGMDYNIQPTSAKRSFTNVS